MMSVNSLSITREMVQAAVVKYNDSQQPYNGLWLSYRQIDHLLDLARQQQRAECVEALKKFHKGSCRRYYVEDVCTCGLEEAISRKG